MRKNEDRVLEYVNGLRGEYGIGEPLPYLPPDLTIEQWKKDGEITRSCPIALALGTNCGYNTISIGGGLVRFPSYVRDFIVEHDKRFEDLRNAYEKVQEY